jgi:AhpD family alkylhydroperoxidase
MEAVEQFNNFREEMNESILNSESLVFKRLFSLDTLTYQNEQQGKQTALSPKVKELIGLSVSLSLRCDDCVKYHVLQLQKLGATKQEVIEALEVATVIGGTIVIPHLRRAFYFMQEIKLI